MTSPALRLLVAPALAVAMIASFGAASAQDQTGTVERSPGFLDRVFGGGQSPEPAPRDRTAQASGSELSMRLDRLEAQIRQLTGLVEQLQHQNQQLEAQVRRSQEDTEYRYQELGGKGTAATGRPAAPPAARPPAVAPPASTPGRRGDAFDPSQSPNAPGAPRVLGALPDSPNANPPNAIPPSSIPAVPDIARDEPPPEVPGGRSPGAPLDLSTLAGRAASDPALAPPAPNEGPGPAPRNPNAGGQQMATLPPANSPRDEFDLSYGYVQRKDYALAEEGFRTFLRKYPSDRLAPEAQFWLGESMFQSQRFRDAAEAFLNVSTKYETTAKAPDALLRLGQSLAALGEKEAACASLAEVLRKYPKASIGVKQGVDREQKRARC
jgi:tol-pal system protein YbgF